MSFDNKGTSLAYKSKNIMAFTDEPCHLTPSLQDTSPHKQDVQPMGI
jgi:hypothetical protein